MLTIKFGPESPFDTQISTTIASSNRRLTHDQRSTKDGRKITQKKTTCPILRPVYIAHSFLRPFKVKKDCLNPAQLPNPGAQFCSDVCQVAFIGSSAGVDSVFNRLSEPQTPTSEHDSKPRRRKFRSATFHCDISNQWTIGWRPCM